MSEIRGAVELRDAMELLATNITTARIDELSARYKTIGGVPRDTVRGVIPAHQVAISMAVLDELLNYTWSVERTREVFDAWLARKMIESGQ